MTTNVVVTKTWSKVAESSAKFLITNVGNPVVEVAFQATDAAPAAGITGHALKPWEQLSRMSTTGPCPDGYVFARVLQASTCEATTLAVNVA
jgi:hypothetical protein